MNQRTLRPIDYGEIISKTLNLYKDNILLFLGISVLLYLPLNVAIGIVMSKFMSTFSPIPTPDISNIDWSVFVGLGIVYLISIPFTYAVMGALAWASKRRYFGEEASILDSYTAILPRLGAFILTGLLSGLAIMVGLLFCCIPGIVIGFFFSLLTPVFVLDGRAYIDALKRSWQLVLYDWVRVLVMSLIIFAIAFFVQVIITAPFQFASFFAKGDPFSNSPMIIAKSIAQGFGQALSQPLATISFVILYYDIRLRKEGFGSEATSESTVVPDVTPAELGANQLEEQEGLQEENDKTE